MPVIDMEETGKKIKAVCRERGFSVAEVAEKVGVTKVAVYKWFRGESVPSIDNVVVLAAIFQTKIDDVIAVRTA